MNRLHYFILSISTLAVGYFSRQNTSRGDKEEGTFIHDYAGDAIWAAMIYFGFRFLFPSQSQKKTFLITLLFTYLIEISQLYQADWINTVRHTKLGGLILGFGFLWSDLLMYFFGILSALALDNLLSKKIM